MQSSGYIWTFLQVICLAVLFKNVGLPSFCLPFSCQSLEYTQLSSRADKESEEESEELAAYPDGSTGTSIDADTDDTLGRVRWKQGVGGWVSFWATTFFQVLASSISLNLFRSMVFNHSRSRTCWAPSTWQEVIQQKEGTYCYKLMGVKARMIWSRELELGNTSWVPAGVGVLLMRNKPMVGTREESSSPLGDHSHFSAMPLSRRAKSGTLWTCMSSMDLPKSSRKMAALVGAHGFMILLGVPACGLKTTDLDNCRETPVFQALK